MGHCTTAVKEIEVPADINSTAKNIFLISNCIEIKAE
jgi:hypothetical protein